MGFLAVRIRGFVYPPEADANITASQCNFKTQSDTFTPTCFTEDIMCIWVIILRNMIVLLLLLTCMPARAATSTLTPTADAYVVRLLDSVVTRLKISVTMCAS